MAYIQSRSVNSGSVNSATLAYNSNVAAESLLIQAVRVGGGTATVAMTDNQSNSYTQDKLQASGTDHRTSVHSAPNAVAGATTVTATLTGGPATRRWAIHEYGSMATSAPVDVSASGSGSSTAPDSGNANTTVTNDLLFGAASCNDDRTFEAGTNYTLREHIPAAPFGKLGTEDRNLVAIGTYSASFTLSTSSAWACILVAYKPPAAAGDVAAIRSRGLRTLALTGAGI